MNLLKVLTGLAKVLKKERIPYAFMGGVATSFYAFPRATYDLDALILIRDSGIFHSLTGKLKRAGFRFQGKSLRRISGFNFICLDKDKLRIDLFLAEGEFLISAVKRRRRRKFGKDFVYLISPEDLILLKLISGRRRDLDDVREVLKSGRIDFKHLYRWSGKLGVKVFLEEEIKSLGLKKKSR